MKYNLSIIARDNYGRDNVSERLILSGLHEYLAPRICGLLNQNEGFADPNPQWFYVVVDYDYKLYEWEP